MSLIDFELHEVVSLKDGCESLVVAASSLSLTGAASLPPAGSIQARQSATSASDEMTVTRPDWHC